MLISITEYVIWLPYTVCTEAYVDARNRESRLYVLFLYSFGSLGYISGVVTKVLQVKRVMNTSLKYNKRESAFIRWNASTRNYKGWIEYHRA